MDPWAQLKMAVRTVISLTECASSPSIREEPSVSCPPDTHFSRAHSLPGAGASTSETPLS